MSPPPRWTKRGSTSSATATSVLSGTVSGNHIGYIGNVAGSQVSYRFFASANEARSDKNP